MSDLVTILEERTRDWHARGRQDLADSLWSDYVTARFAGTGDHRALEFLYPYLNHADRVVRGWAIKIAGRVFERCGPKAIDAIDYLVKHRDPFIRDRAVRVVGTALGGWPVDIVLKAFEPYLNHRNRFVRQRAVHALLFGAKGTASDTVLSEIRRVAADAQAPQAEVDHAIANVFAGQPTEEAYELIARSDAEWRWWGTDLAVGVMIRGAPEEWYARACEQFFEPRLNADASLTPHPQFLHREALHGLCFASPGKGMAALRRILHLRHGKCTIRASVGGSSYFAAESPTLLLAGAPTCFIHADRPANFEPLAELVRSGDIPAKRIAAVCLGKLMEGAEDRQTISLLTEACNEGNGAVQAAALIGLAMAARSTCDESLRKLCLDRVTTGETARAALQALGRIFQGSARSDVFEDVRRVADRYRNRHIRGKGACKPLAECYRAIGFVYLGTGSTEPFDFLLDALSPSPAQRLGYLWAASRALVMIEFPESTLRRAFAVPDTMRQL